MLEAHPLGELVSLSFIMTSLDQVYKLSRIFGILYQLYQSFTSPQASMLTFSSDGLGGATIGKRIMGIKVVRCESLTPVADRPRTVLVKPGTDVGLWR